MDETNFDWDDLRLFLAVARGGGLAAAAQATEKSAPTLGRRMLALERRLGTDLFKRHSRGYLLTEQGNELLTTAINVEQSMGLFSNSAGKPAPRRVKISAGMWVTRLLCHHVSELTNDPSVVLQFISADQLLDIAHREAVIGIRNQRPTQVNLAGRRIKKIRFSFYAVHENVNTWASVLASTPSAIWVKEHRENSPFIEVSNSRNALDMAIAGSVKMVLPTFVGDSIVGLHKMSDDISELEHTQWLVAHHEDRHVPYIRHVIDQIHRVLESA